MLFSGLVIWLKSFEIARKYIYISENRNRVKSLKNGLKMQARFPGCWWAGFSILFPGFFGLFRACLVGLVGWCIIRNRKARKTGLQAGFPGKEKPGLFCPVYFWFYFVIFSNSEIITSGRTNKQIMITCVFLLSGIDSFHTITMLELLLIPPEFLLLLL